MATSQALDLAAEAGLQLVEVNPKANPPVCKIMDYGKFKYESAKRDREAKKNQKTFELKEVKFRPKTHGHDFDFKLRHIRRFIEDGDKVKLVVQFRGREVTHPETGRAILDRVVQGALDLAIVIQVAQMEGNRMNMVLAPKRDMSKSAKPVVRPTPRPSPSKDGLGLPAAQGVGDETSEPLDDEYVEDIGDDDDDDLDDDIDDDAPAGADDAEIDAVPID